MLSTKRSGPAFYRFSGQASAISMSGTGIWALPSLWSSSRSRYCFSPQPTSCRCNQSSWPSGCWRLHQCAFDAIRRMRLGRRGYLRPWYRSTWFAAAIMIAASVAGQYSRIPNAINAWRGILVQSDSNSPTLVRNDRVLTSTRLAKRPPDYGQMVIFRNPRDRGIEYMARIVGLPGDLVQLKNGILYLNDRPVTRQPHDLPARLQSKRYAATVRQYEEALPNGRSYMVLGDARAPPKDIAPTLVSPDHVFVINDGRSFYDRYYAGVVPAADIRAEVKLMIWPASRDYGRLLSLVR